MSAEKIVKDDDDVNSIMLAKKGSEKLQGHFLW